MSKQKSTPDLSKVKIKMSDLVNVALKTEGLFAEALFGWSVDRQIAKIGDLAKQAVDYKIGEELTLIRSKRMSIEDEYRKPYEGQEHTLGQCNRRLRIHTGESENTGRRSEEN
jgi:hypothetical protein